MENLQFRESTQFPPSITSDSTYVRSFTDETSATNTGLYQTIQFNPKEVVSQYILVNNKKYTLSTDITVDDSLEMINNLLR